MSSTHANGAPHWFELATPDPAGANAFYGGLFGWTADASAIAGGYTVFRLDGREVAGAYALPDALRARGVPPGWGVYFRVADVDAAAARVVAGGGRVIVPPFEAGGHLRAAACADPEGAVFLLAQPRGHDGAAALREPGAVCWTELATRDLDRAQAFYGDVLGWTVQPHHASPPSVYRIFANADGMLGGFLAMTPEWGAMPSHWALYVQVDDVDAVAARAQALGAGRTSRVLGVRCAAGRTHRAHRGSRGPRLLRHPFRRSGVMPRVVHRTVRRRIAAEYVFPSCTRRGRRFAARRGWRARPARPQ